MSHQITISVFLFLQKYPDLSFGDLERDFGFSCLNYDEDMCEMGGADDWSLQSLSKAVTSMSWSECWSEQAVEQARELGITKCRRVLIVPWDDYQPRKMKKKRPEDPVLIGPFRFEDPDA